MELKIISKIALISTLLVCSTHSIISQDRLLKKAYNQLNESNWEEFDETLNKYLTKGGEKNAAYHYLWSLYFQKSTDYDPVNWYEELIVSYSALKLLTQDERIKNCTAFNFCINNEKEEISKVINVIFKEYENQNTISFWEEFINKYATHSLDLKYKAEKNIEELAFQNAIKRNTESIYIEFIKDYSNSNSDRLDKAHENWEKLAFNRVISANFIDDYNNFLFDFPNSTHKELILKNIQEIEYQQVLKEAEYPNGTIDPIKKHLIKYPNNKNKSTLGELYFKLISAGLNYNHNDVNLYQDFLNLFDVNENQMKTLAELVNETWDLDLMEFFIKEFPFYDQIKEIEENRKWCIETDSLINITEMAINGTLFDSTPRNVKETSNGVTIHTRSNIVSLKDAKNRGADTYENRYISYLPLFNNHLIEETVYTWVEDSYHGFYDPVPDRNFILVDDKNGKKYFIGDFEESTAKLIRHKKNIYLLALLLRCEGPCGVFGLNVYKYNNQGLKLHTSFGYETPFWTDYYDDLTNFTLDLWNFRLDKTDFQSSKKIKLDFKNQDNEDLFIEYIYSEENDSWNKIENIIDSKYDMYNYIEKAIQNRKPIELSGTSQKPENCKEKNHYSNSYKSYYDGLCYSSVFITQWDEINSLPINYSGFIYPLKLNNDNILIGTTSNEEHYSLTHPLMYAIEDYDENELIFIDFKKALENKEIILPE